MAQIGTGYHMAVSELEMFQDQQRSNWVRLWTLVVLRWFAISGQIIAVLCAILIFDLRFEVGLASMTIGASVLGNLFSSALYPRNKQLSEREAAAMLGFDILQLGLLLYLTGGLNNPFALLMLAPVTIAATVLHLRSTVVTGLLAIVIITALSQFYLPLFASNGQSLMLPDLFLFGVWLALVIGVVFLAIYARQVTTEMHTMGEALVATRLALAREQKLTDLGGVVAAAAHELGTPLATIKLVSTELMDELRGQTALYDDAALIGAQADRCRDILQSMGRAGKDDLHMRRAPLETVLRDAAEPHKDRGKAVNFAFLPDPGQDDRQPIIIRRPEIIHGLRNLIQNAVDFAATAVDIEVRWSQTMIAVRIEDDGPGFPPPVMERIGLPFMHGRKQIMGRPGYEGMGLGLFIAKTLLERTGATLRFANATEHSGGGAIIAVDWPRNMIDPDQGAVSEPLGDNPPILS
jgi:two-component system, sensor histidine kinase RegB